MTPLLSARELSVQAGDTRLLNALNLDLSQGQILAVLGRNGAGKSLLMHSLAGLREPAAGVVTLQGRALTTLKRREVARLLGFLPQDTEAPAQVPVIEWVLGGRYAHGSEFRWPSEEDQRIAATALERVNLAPLAQRWLHTLSGGEQRRAALATLLAQDPAVMLLDEPTNHLDPQQIVSVMQLARAACAAGTGVVMTLHDPQLANRWADQVLLVHGDGRWHLGPTAQILSAEAVSQLYGTPFTALRDGERTVLLQA